MNDAPRFPDHAPRPAGAPTALDGIRVVDFSRVLAGPWATQYLADMGADVIKVEDPSGDMARRGNGHIQDDISGFFLCTNRNKRSIVLDLATEEGREVALDLIGQADVLVENFTTRVMAGFGLDHASIRERFPRLIYCSISAYGRTGSLADAPGFDPIIACESGVAALNALDGAKPFAGSLPVIDLSAAMNAAIAILGALMARERLGLGQFVETSLFDSALANLSYKGAEYLATGATPYTIGRRATHPPGGEFETASGSVWFATPSEKNVRQLLCTAFDRADLYADPRFATHEARRANRALLDETITEILSTADSEEWARRFKAAGIPGGAMRSIPQAYHADITSERGLVRDIPHPVIGRVANVASPIRMSLTPTVDPVAAPSLGEQGDAILRDELGYDAERIARLRAAGAIGKSRADATASAGKS